MWAGPDWLTDWDYQTPPGTCWDRLGTAGGDNDIPLSSLNSSIEYLVHVDKAQKEGEAVNSLQCLINNHKPETQFSQKKTDT